MPKVKPNRSKQSRDDDSDEEMTQTQGPSMTQAEKAMASMDLEQVERKTNDLVQFLLIMDQKKIPVKRQDINKNVLKEHSRAFPKFMDGAAEKLKNDFGIELVDISEKKKAYILINMLETDVDKPHMIWPAEDNAKTGLLMVILSTIYMSGNILDEAKLYCMLKKLGVDVDMNHELFGDVKKFISTELVRQGYLVYERQDHSDPPAHNYRWGPRAKYETCKRNVLDFVCQVYGDTDPSKWTSQWEDMMESEEGTANGTTK